MATLLLTRADVESLVDPVALVPARRRTALAAHALAHTDAEIVAVIGAGRQGTHQLRPLDALRPLGRVWVHDIVPDRAAAFARAMAVELDVHAGVLAPGAHVTTLGADEPGKAEVAAELGEVLGGMHPGRTAPEQITVYGGVGLAFQGAVAGGAAYEGARTRGVGREVDFLA